VFKKGLIMKSKKRSRIISTLDIFTLGILIATLFGFLSRLWWFFDLFSHFRVQYMQLCLPLIGIALWKRLNKRAIACVLLACVNYALVLPLYSGKPAPATSKPARAMLMNILAINGNTEQVLEAIEQADPDLLLLEEVTPIWEDELKVLNSTYPYRVAEPQEGCFGIMLLSKHPIKNGTVREIGKEGLPSITADIYFPDGEISVIGTHPLPPVGGRFSNSRNEQLAALPEVVVNQKHPVLLIGDLNVSPWTPHFSNLIKESGLKNSMQGFGFQPTWPAQLPFLKIPLDHMLHSEGITIHNRMVGKSVGSDHLPVIVDFTVMRK